MTDTDRPVDGESTDSGSLSGETDPEAVPEFGDLSVLQRGFVAAAQNPSRGILVVGLFAFALAFYVAFWLAFPAAAGLLSGVAVVVVVVAGLVYWILDRLSG